MNPMENPHLTNLLIQEMACTTPVSSHTHPAMETKSKPVAQLRLQDVI